MELNVKRVRPNAKISQFKTEGAVAMDFYASLEGVPANTRGMSDRELTILPGEVIAIPLGVAIQLEPGYEMRIRPRSSIMLRGIIIATFDDEEKAGTIDSDYRGEVHAIFQNYSKVPFVLSEGERVCQGIISRVECPANGLVIKEVDELDSTERGEKRFGHTNDNE